MSWLHMAGMVSCSSNQTNYFRDCIASTVATKKWSSTSGRCHGFVAMWSSPLPSMSSAVVPVLKFSTRNSKRDRMPCRYTAESIHRPS
jgi:hypothetical protein